MSGNGLYTYSGAFIPGTLARAEQVGTEYTAVQAGFALLAIQGIDSGSANTYVVTTNGGPSGAYADGSIVEFKAATSSTGASTINVNNIGVVSLTAPGGTSLASGAITAGTWYRAMYNSTYSAFTLVAPIVLSTTSNTISSAAPTNKIGLVAAGGVSTACTPIDATYALDQSIAPTWTGAHTFANAVTFNSTVSFAGGLSLTGGSSQYAATLTGSAVSGHSLGLEVNAGTNASDIAFLVNSQSGGTQFFEINGQGSVTVGSPAGGAQGVGTINAAGLFVNGAAVKTTSISSANPSAVIGLSAVNGVAATFMTSDSAPALSQAIAPTWTAAHVFTPSSAVTAVTINAAVNAVGAALVGGTNTVNTYLLTLATGQGSGFSSGISLKAGTTSADNALFVQNAAASATYAQIKGDGSGSIGYNGSAATIAFAASGAVSIPAATAAVGLTVAGAANQFAELVSGNSTSGQSYGLKVAAGTTSADQAMAVTNQAANTSYFQVRGDGKISGGGPTAGALVDMTPDTGTFTGTVTGMSVTFNPVCVFSRQGNQVMLSVGTAVGTNSAGSTILLHGVPAALIPARQQNVVSSGVLSTGLTPIILSNIMPTGTFTLGASPIGTGAPMGIGTAMLLPYPVN